MVTRQQPAITAFTIGLIGLGILALIYGDFALVWQPVPSSVPGRQFLAYASGILMLLGGAGLLFRATASWCIRLLCPYMLIWLLLKVPALLLVPKMEAVWLNFGEIAVLFAATLTLVAKLSPQSTTSRIPTSLPQRLVSISTILFGISLIPIGLSHFVYTDQTVSLIPTWFPFRSAVAYLTGAGQICCGLCVLLSLVPRVAARVEAGLVGLFALFVWAPAIFLKPESRLSWTAFVITWLFAASAWVMSQNLSDDLRQRPY